MAINGTSSNDSLNGTSGDDTIYGFGGDDLIWGWAGNDYLDGGDGNDNLYPYDGNDTVYGGAGNDLINAYLTYGGKFIDGNTGNDTVWGGNSNDTIYGGDGNDDLSGHNGNDFLDGGNGNDSLDGGNGDDSIYGGNGNDYLVGGAGSDTIITNDGNDTVYGGSGDDLINGYLTTGHAYTFWSSIGNLNLYGEDGNDVIIGDQGADYISGGTGNDELYGRDSADTLIGGNGNDYLSGDAGNDSLDGGAGNDTIYGGDGNDILIGGSGIDYLYGGSGNDTYYISSQTSYIDDSGGTDTAVVSTSFVKLPSSIENVTYTNGALALPYWIDALLPDDTAGLRYQSLLGDAKTYKFAFPSVLPSYDASSATGWMAFNATQISQARSALSYIASVLDLTFVESSVVDAPNTIAFANNSQGNSSGYAFYPDSSSTGSDLFLNKNVTGNLTIADGTFDAYTLMHELGHTLGLEHPFSTATNVNGGDPPYLTGSEDSTTWTVMSYTYNSAQYHFQYSPLDVAALQYLYGPSKTSRTGNDVYIYSPTSANFIWDGAGTDKIDASSSNQAVTIYLAPGYWGYGGATKASTITAAGQIAVNLGTQIENLDGSNYADYLYGNELNNVVNGGSGNDSIDGGLGNDSLSGSPGNDTLIGGSGNDALTGGTGNDFFNVDSAIDTISDFTVGSDTLNISAGATALITLASTSSYDFSKDVTNNGVLSITTSGAGSYNLSGTSGNDILTSGAGDDIINGKGGADTINGGAGIDTLIFASFSNKNSLKYVSGNYLVTDATSGAVNTLSNIERLQFSDKKLAVDMGATQSAGETAELIGAVLGNNLMLSKKGLLGTVIGLFDQGHTLQQLSGAILRLPIWDVLTGQLNPTNADIANYLYKTVNGSLPAASTLSAAVNALDTETEATQGTYLATLAASSANQTQINLVGLQQTGLEYI